MRIRIACLLLIGCGTAAGAPDSEPPIASPPTANPPSATTTTPTRVAQRAQGCDAQPFIASPQGTATQYDNLSFDGRDLVFLENVTWEESSKGPNGDFVTVADGAGATRRIARFDGGPQAVVFDASAYYVGVWGTAQVTGDGTGWLARVDRATSEVTTLASGLSLSWSLAATDDSLVYTTRTPDDKDTEVRLIPKSGGAWTVIGNGVAERARIVTDATGVYWIGPQKLLRYANGKTTELASGTLVPTALARHGDLVFFADADGVSSVSIDGGSPTRIAAAPRVVEVIADAHGVAWIASASYAGDLAMNDDAVLMAAAGGAPVKVAGVRSPQDLVGDDKWLYWVDNHSAIMRICRP
jgi:hypothetical protein